MEQRATVGDARKIDENKISENEVNLILILSSYIITFY